MGLTRNGKPAADIRIKNGGTSTHKVVVSGKCSNCHFSIENVILNTNHSTNTVEFHNGDFSEDGAVSLVEEGSAWAGEKFEFISTVIGLDSNTVSKNYE